MDGKQIVLINAFNKREGYFHRMNAEQDIRDISKKFGHTYTLGLFACCREIWRSNRHCGLFGPTRQLAIDHFSKIRRAEITVKLETEDAKKIEAKKVLDDDLQLKSAQIVAVVQEKEAQQFGK